MHFLHLWNMKKTHKNIVRITSILVTVFLFITVVFWTYIPFRQMATFSKAFREVRAGNPERMFTNEEKIFSRFTFVQPELRYQFIDFLFRDFSAEPTPDAPPALALAMEKLEEGLAVNSDYANHILALGKGYDLQANLGIGDVDELRKKAEEVYLDALEIFPDNQRITFAYAINIANQRRIDEAIEIVEEVYEADPRVAESNFYYGALLYMKDNTGNADRALPHFEYVLDRIPDPMPVLTITIYRKMLSHYYTLRDTERFYKVTKRLVQLDPDQKEAYETILSYMDEQGVIPNISIE